MVYRILVKQVEWFAEFLPGYEKKGILITAAEEMNWENGIRKVIKRKKL